jgi:hypothetical protein
LAFGRHRLAPAIDLRVAAVNLVLGIYAHIICLKAGVACRESWGTSH